MVSYCVLQYNPDIRHFEEKTRLRLDFGSSGSSWDAFLVDFGSLWATFGRLDSTRQDKTGQGPTGEGSGGRGFPPTLIGGTSPQDPKPDQDRTESSN